MVSEQRSDPERDSATAKATQFEIALAQDSYKSQRAVACRINIANTLFRLDLRKPSIDRQACRVRVPRRDFLNKYALSRRQNACASV